MTQLNENNDHGDMDDNKNIKQALSFFENDK